MVDRRYEDVAALVVLKVCTVYLISGGGQAQWLHQVRDPLGWVGALRHWSSADVAPEQTSPLCLTPQMQGEPGPSVRPRGRAHPGARVRIQGSWNEPDCKGM